MRSGMELDGVLLKPAIVNWNELVCKMLVRHSFVRGGGVRTNIE